MVHQWHEHVVLRYAGRQLDPVSNLGTAAGYDALRSLVGIAALVLKALGRRGIAGRGAGIVLAVDLPWEPSPSAAGVGRQRHRS